MALVLWPRAAHAQTRSFSAGSLIIPMDACYQPAVDTLPPSGCQNGNRSAGDGVVKAYGLVYLLLKRGITVYVVTDPDKTGISAPDLTLTQAGAQGPPVGLYNRGTGVAQNFNSLSSITYRGAPFLIDVGEAASVRDLLANDPLISTFTSVAIHVSYVPFLAPVSLRMNGVPPRIAVFVPDAGKGGSAGSENLPLMQAYLLRAGLNYTGSVGTAAAPGEIYDILSDDDVLAGRLRPSVYQVLWLPHFDGSSSDNPTLLAFASFADQGGIIIGQCASIKTLESFASTRFLSTSSSISYNRASGVACYPGNPAGWNRSGYNTTNWNSSQCFDPKTPVAPNPGSAMAYPAPAHPLVQIGDFPLYIVPGTIVDYTPAGLKATGRALIRAQDSSSSRDGAFYMSVVYKDGDSSKGQIIYFGGHFYGDIKAPITAGIRIVLNTLLFARPTLNQMLLTRSSSTQITISNSGVNQNLLLQGAYEEANSNGVVFSRAADAASFVFPQTPGHLLAFDVSRLTTGFQRLSVTNGLVFDHARLLPAAAARTLYTSSGTGAAAQLVPLTSAGLAQVGTNPFNLSSGYAAADQDALLAKVRAAPLGGIDHSTVAVVGQQTLVSGGSSRPTVAYAGGLDGMLHAVVVAGGSLSAGSELWAFLPGQFLPNVRNNSTGLDGSPNIGDTYDLVGGARAFRTLLVIPQGSYGTNVFAVDISQPQAPRLLWNRGTTASGVVLGNAGGAAQAMVSTPTDRYQSVVVIASNRVGASAGLWVSGLAGADGQLLWQFSTAYQRLLPGTTAPVPNDQPARAILGPSVPSGVTNRVYAADLDGRVWELDAATGANVNGTAPLADVGLTPQGNTQPIGVPPALAIERETGRLLLLVVTGGVDWAAPNDTYALYAFDLSQSARVAGRTSGVATQRFRTALPAGQRGYAPPTVSGNDVYLVASSGLLSGRIGATSGDVASLLRIGMASGQISNTTAVSKGAGAFALTSDGSIIGATARDIWVVRASGADSRGVSVGSAGTSPVLRRLWLDSR